MSLKVSDSGSVAPMNQPGGQPAATPQDGHMDVGAHTVSKKLPTSDPMIGPPEPAAAKSSTLRSLFSGLGKVLSRMFSRTPKAHRATVRTDPRTTNVAKGVLQPGAKTSEASKAGVAKQASEAKPASKAAKAGAVNNPDDLPATVDFTQLNADEKKMVALLQNYKTRQFLLAFCGATKSPGDFRFLMDAMLGKRTAGYMKEQYFAPGSKHWQNFGSVGNEAFKRTDGNFTDAFRAGLNLLNGNIAGNLEFGPSYNNKEFNIPPQYQNIVLTMREDAMRESSMSGKYGWD